MTFPVIRHEGEGWDKEYFDEKLWRLYKKVVAKIKHTSIITLMRALKPAWTVVIDDDGKIAYEFGLELEDFELLEDMATHVVYAFISKFFI